MVQGSAVQKWVHNDKGYVIGYFKAPQRNQISITLYRYYVNGKPLLNLEGFDNKKVRLIENKETK